MSKKLVIKIGGSIIRKGLLKQVLTSITHLSHENDTIVITGGGGLADEIRNYDKSYGLDKSSSHFLAIKTMDLNSELVESLDKKFKAVKTLQRSSKEKIPVLKTEKILRDSDIPHSWEVTSDSISLFVAEEIGAKHLLLIKDVDGIYGKDKKIIKEINSENLDKLESSCLDKYFPKVKTEKVCKTFIVSGTDPQRIKNYSEESTVKTIVRHR